jgi:hypothetical protein
MNFFLSDEAQLIHDSEGMTMVTKIVAPKTTQAANAIRSGHLLGTTDASRQDEMLRLAKEIYQ